MLLSVFSPDAHLVSYFGIISYLHQKVEEGKFVKLKSVNFTFLRIIQVVKL